MISGPEELGGRVGTKTVAGYAAPGTPLNDPEKWEGGMSSATYLKVGARLFPTMLCKQSILSLALFFVRRPAGASNLSAIHQPHQLKLSG